VAGMTALRNVRWSGVRLALPQIWRRRKANGRTWYVERGGAKGV